MDETTIDGLRISDLQHPLTASVTDCSCPFQRLSLVYFNLVYYLQYGLEVARSNILPQLGDDDDCILLD